MKQGYKNLLTVMTASAVITHSSLVLSDSLSDALSSGKVYGDFRLRYESVEQDNSLSDADALTLRTRLGYKTGSIGGFSALIEFEDSRIVGGVGDYTVGPTGFNVGEFSVIADPKSSEVDQGYIAYTTDQLTVKLGRQVIALNNQRFVGHVGWRQDRQTFDAFRADYTPLKNLTLTYSYIGQRNRIFADDGDIDSKDHLINATYKTTFGKVTGYAYLLEIDNDVDNSLDTYGISFQGATKNKSVNYLYNVEFATQESDVNGVEFDTDYYLLEAGIVTHGITAKIGYEVLGSDDGDFGFATPLATLHKFNGWADQFLATPAQGLEDAYLSVGGSLAGGKWAVIYHDFSADESSAGIDDLGSEIDLLYVKTIAKNYKVGVKYADYSADDSKVDAEKLWLWVSTSF